MTSRDELSRTERVILSAIPGTETGRVIDHLLLCEKRRAERMVEDSEIGCSAYQRDIRYALGYAAAVRRITEAFVKGDVR